MLKLRSYQEECLAAIKNSWSVGRYRQLVSLPTGAGKTVIFANLIKDLDCRTLILAHTCELLDQAKEKINMICPSLDVGIINGQSKQFDKQVIICSIQAAAQSSTYAKLQEQDFKLVIADEAHHFAAEKARKTLTDLGFGNGTTKLLVGFTATPFRQDGKGLGEVFDVIAYERNIKQMIEEGYLCLPTGLKIATDIDLSKIKTVGGDFEGSDLSKIMNTPEMNQIIVESFLKSANQRQAICFGVDIQHAKNLSESFQKHDVNSKAIYGSMSKEERTQILEDYKAGTIQVLCNCQVLTEGFDAPQTSCIIVARPTKSKGLYQQMIGRGLRLWPNKQDCIILDCNDKNHNICSTAKLLQDVVNEPTQLSEEKQEKREFQEKLPAKLNKKLKSAIITFDPLGESFSWTKEGKIYVIKGVSGCRLEVIPIGNDKFKVVLLHERRNQLIADELSFEYAFSAAEDFAKANRKLFVISDINAAWRDLPISERQLACIRAKGYKSGIEHLTRGQASVLIGSGALLRAIYG